MRKRSKGGYTNFQPLCRSERFRCNCQRNTSLIEGRGCVLSRWLVSRYPWKTAPMEVLYKKGVSCDCPVMGKITGRFD